MKISANFSREEFTCKCGCGLYNLNQDFLDMLQKARSEAGFPFVIHSGCRCELHNRMVGGKAGSSHVDGLACDIRALSGDTRFKLIDILLAVGFHRIGVAKDFVHCDIDRSKPTPNLWPY